MRRFKLKVVKELSLTQTDCNTRSHSIIDFYRNIIRKLVMMRKPVNNDTKNEI